MVQNFEAFNKRVTFDERLKRLVKSHTFDERVTFFESVPTMRPGSSCTKMQTTVAEKKSESTNDDYYTSLFNGCQIL
jgi:hypothetical protein